MGPQGPILSNECLSGDKWFPLQPLYPILSLYSPTLPQEDLEAIRAALRYRQLEAVVAHTPDDSRGVHIFVGDLSCQHLPQHHPKRPTENINTSSVIVVLTVVTSARKVLFMC